MLKQVSTLELNGSDEMGTDLWTYAIGGPT